MKTKQARKEKQHQMIMNYKTRSSPVRILDVDIYSLCCSEELWNTQKKSQRKWGRAAEEQQTYYKNSPNLNLFRIQWLMYSVLEHVLIFHSLQVELTATLWYLWALRDNLLSRNSFYNGTKEKVKEKWQGKEDKEKSFQDTQQEFLKDQFFIEHTRIKN